MQKAVRVKLLRWYSLNKRDLPWRKTTDPYLIWLSEIILQQTRVIQGTPYYQRFIQAFPNVRALAEADEQEIMKLWQGLGYYSRARNLHGTAKIILKKYNCIFPQRYEELILLKGIGPYTAAAILSQAFQQPYAVLDGNVYRVLARLYADFLPINLSDAASHYLELAQDLLDKQHPGTFNQAMMELGAMVCKPTKPDCTLCPINKECLAYKKGIQEQLPVKIPKPPVRNRFFNYLCIEIEGKVALKKRQKGDIWQGMYDFPLIEKQTEGLHQVEVEQFLELPISNMQLVKKISHKLTHQNLYICFYKIDTSLTMLNFAKDYIFVPIGALDDYPHPKPIEIFLKEFHYI